MLTVKRFSKYVRAKLAKKAAIEKSPLVTFFYPMSKEPWNSKLRQVRLIAASSAHLIGLELSKEGDRVVYRYKKFCQPKVTGFQFQEFNPSAIK